MCIAFLATYGKLPCTSAHWLTHATNESRSLCHRIRGSCHFAGRIGRSCTLLKEVLRGLLQVAEIESLLIWPTPFLLLFLLRFLFFLRFDTSGNRVVRAGSSTLQILAAACILIYQLPRICFRVEVENHHVAVENILLQTSNNSHICRVPTVEMQPYCWR